MPSSLPIAVVDDDRSVREAIVMLLRSHGLAAVGFDSAEQFIQSFQAGKYGCLVSDVQMPGMDGPELAGWLAERDIHLPVVLMTARAGERLPALPANTRAVLRKPFACDALADILRTVMRPS